MKLIIMVCTKKILFRAKWAILVPKMAHPHNSGLALRMKGANRQMKLMLMIFFKKFFVKQLGKSYSATWTFKCRGSTAVVLVSFVKIIDRKGKNYLDLPQVNSHVALGDIFHAFLVFYFLIYSRILLKSVFNQVPLQRYENTIAVELVATCTCLTCPPKTVTYMHRTGMKNLIIIFIYHFLGIQVCALELKF